MTKRRRWPRLWRTSVEEEVESELAFHLEMTTRELMEQGMSLTNARAEAQRRFGDSAAINAECRRYGTERDRRAVRAEYRHELRQDATFAIRQLLRARGFTIVAILTLALGIGATAAVFSALDAVALRPLPYANADRIVAVHPTRKGETTDPSAPEYLAYRTVPAFERVAAAVLQAGITLRLRDVPEMITGGRVTADYFAVFGAHPLVGRTFTADEDSPGRANVAVISYRLWMSHFNGDRAAVGRVVELDGAPHTILGVMPKEFDLTRGSEDIWTPIAFSSEDATKYGEHYLKVYARLKPAVTLEQAHAAMIPAERTLAERLPFRTLKPTDYGIDVHRYRDDLVGGYQSLLLVLLGAVSFVLLIACGNVANLLLARASARTKELAIRAALGAGRGRIVRQLLTESVVLGLTAALVGLALAYGGIKVLVAAAPEGIPRLNETRVDLVVLAFAVLVALASSVVFGLVPSLRASRQDVQSTLREGGRGAGAVRDHVRQALVVAEVALACTLLAGAGLLVRSALYLQQVQPGFDPAGVVTARVALPAEAYKDPTRAMQAFRAVAERVAAAPGVRAASIVSNAPLGGGGSNGLVPEGQPLDMDHIIQSSLRMTVPGYLAAMRIPLLKGRDFTAQDVAGAQRVMIVSETLAKKAWPNEDPIGKRIACCEGDEKDPRYKTVIGVAGDVRSSGPAVDVSPEFYLPMEQAPPEAWDWIRRTMTVVVRGTADDDAHVAALTNVIRGAVRQTEPAAPVFAVRPMREQIRGATAESRFNTLLLGILGAAGLVLAMVGIYGVVSYFVAQRTTEIGVRMALGASPGDVLRLLTLQGARPIVLGVGVGTAFALAATRLLQSAVRGVSPTDPVALGGAAAVLVLAGLLAAVLPARRATRVDPAETIMRS